MKTALYLILTAVTLLMASSEAAAQCFDHSIIPGVARIYRFQLEGRAFAFDRLTGDIFCENVKIGVRTPDGQVRLLPDAAARLDAAGPAPGVPAQTVSGPVGAVAATSAPANGPIGGPANGGGIAAPGSSGAAVVAGDAPAAGNAGPANLPGPNAPAANPAGPGAAAPATAAPTSAVGSQLPPAAATAQPAAAAPIASTPASAASGAIPVLGSGNDPALQSSQVSPDLLSGQWRAESRDILGRSVIRELTFERDNNLTFRVQVQGDAPRLVEGAFELKDGKLMVGKEEAQRELGLLTSLNGQLMLKGEGESLAFNRIQ